MRFKPNAGAIVSPVDDTAWEQEMTALAILEGAATASAQPRLVSSDFARLRELVSLMERSADPVRFGALNREYARWHKLQTIRAYRARRLGPPPA